MVFLCFAVKDRMPLINDFYQFLINFGLDVWYDRRNIFLGDDRYATNICRGAADPKIKYAVVLYSDNFRTGNICLEEYKVLVERYQSEGLVIFPVFLNDVPEKMAGGYELCKKLVYKELRSHEDFLPIALHIIAKVTCDELSNSPYKSIQDVLVHYREKNSCAYRLLVEYENISKEHYAMRIAMLYAIYSILTANNRQKYLHFKTVSYLYHQCCIAPLREEKRELQIFENIVTQEFGSAL